MSCGLIVITACMVVCLLAVPVTAGIKHFADSQGVIRITNVAGAKPRKIPAGPAAVAPGAAASPREAAASPAAAPPEVAAGPPVSGEPVSAAPAQARERHPAAVSAPLATQEEAQPQDNGSRSGPLRRVAFEPENPGTGPVPEIKAESRPPAAVVTEGGIRRFRDKAGVLVITNLSPKSSPPGAPSFQAEGGAAPGRGLRAQEPDRSAAPPAAAGLRPVSWSPDKPLSPPQPVAAAAGMAASGTTGSIRCYRDKHGVIHISNLGTGPPPSSQPPDLPVRAEPVRAAGPPEVRLASPDHTAAAQVAVSPPLKPPELVAPLQLLTAAALPQTGLLLPGNLRRYRDRLGIWRIQTVDHEWLLEAPPLPQPAASPREVLVAAVQAMARLPEAAMQAEAPLPEAVVQAEVPLPEAAVHPPALPPPPRLAAPRYAGGITTLRDRQGRLIITNTLPPPAAGGSQSWMLARAQLDPIIQEAARAYRLPPNLIRAVIKVESNFVNAAVSPKGAMGLMQLMPGTAEFLGVEEPFNPWQNIHGGCRYLRLLMDSFGGSLPLALAGYNAGPQRVVDSGYRVPEINETQNFLNRVLEWYLTEENRSGRPWT